MPVSQTSFLRVGPSKITGQNGCAPGQGLFAVSAKKRKIAFKEGEKIMPDVKYVPALFVTDPDGKANIEWLYSGKRICGLKDGNYVIWSGFTRTITVQPTTAQPEKEINVEFGCQPDSLLIYANHAETPEDVNSIIDISYKTKNKSRGIKRKADDLLYTLKATKDILHDDEILWNYGGQGIPDFTHAYRQPFDCKRYAEHAKVVTAEIIDIEPDEMEVVEDISIFNENRWKEQMNVTAMMFKFSPEEEEILNGMATNPDSKKLNIKSYIDKCNLRGLRGKEKKIIITYLKKKLNGQSEIIAILRSAKKVLSDSGIKLPRPLADHSISSLYQFCVENNIINPENNPGSIPVSWLAKKLTGKPTNLHFKKLLILYIQSVLISAKVNQKSLTITLTKAGVPNPLENQQVQWKISDLQTISALTANIERDKSHEREAIKNYLEASGREVTKHKLPIQDMSGQASLESVKAIALRYLTGEDGVCPNVFLTSMKKSNIQLVVNGENVPPEINNLKNFVREHFTAEQFRDIKGYWCCNNQELLDRFKGNKKGSKRIHSEFYKRIREGDDSLLKPFIEQLCISLPNITPADITKRLRNAKILINKKIDCTPGTLYEFFKDDSGEWLDKLFYLKRLSDDELLKELKKQKDLERSAESQNTYIHHALIVRCQNKSSLVKDYLQACQESTSDKSSYFLKKRVRLFNKYRINEKDNWIPDDIRKLISF